MKTNIALHSDKYSMMSLGDRLGLKGEALKMFAYALCELSVSVEVNEATGFVNITHVDGQAVEQKPTF